MLDAHCHIDLYSNPFHIALETERRGIQTLAVTRLPSHFIEAHSHLLGYRYVWPALGFHPLLVSENFDEISSLPKLLPLTRFIGEVGLDFCTQSLEERDRQREVFEYLLSLIQGQNKILSIHSRRAEAEVLKLLIRYDCPKSIFHWYSGPLNVLQEIIEHGFYVSVNPQMFRTKTGLQIIKRIPADHILTETDGPFIKVGNRAIQPADINQAESALAELWQTTAQQVSQIIAGNFKRLQAQNSFAVAS
jgi:TatD DNase family protein